MGPSVDTFIRQVGAYIVANILVVAVVVVFIVTVCVFRIFALPMCVQNVALLFFVHAFVILLLSLLCLGFWPCPCVYKFIRPVVEVTLQSLKLLSINSKPTQNSDVKNG